MFISCPEEEVWRGGGWWVYHMVGTRLGFVLRLSSCHLVKVQLLPVLGPHVISLGLMSLRTVSLEAQVLEAHDPGAQALWAHILGAYVLGAHVLGAKSSFFVFLSCPWGSCP